MNIRVSKNSNVRDADFAFESVIHITNRNSLKFFVIVNPISCTLCNE